jgi:DNA-binding NtrC family response regulator
MSPSPENGKPNILVADDQPDVLEALRLLLKGNGFDVHAVNSPSAALAALERRDYDAMLLDMNYTRDTTSGKEGLDLLASVQTLEPHMPVVVMTAWGSIDNAVEAMRRGARDYVEKPCDNARLVRSSACRWARPRFAAHSGSVEIACSAATVCRG